MKQTCIILALLCTLANAQKLRLGGYCENNTSYTFADTGFFSDYALLRLEAESKGDGYAVEAHCIFKAAYQRPLKRTRVWIFHFSRKAMSCATFPMPRFTLPRPSRSTARSSGFRPNRPISTSAASKSPGARAMPSTPPTSGTRKTPWT